MLINSSSTHSDNRKNTFSILGEGPTFGINEKFGSPEKKFSINFTKEISIKLHYNADNSYLFVEGKEILKLTIKMLTFQLNFVSEAYLMNVMLLSLEMYF